MTLKVIQNDGTEYTVENVLDFAYWDKEHVHECTSEQLSDEQWDKVYSNVHYRLFYKLEEFADAEMFRIIVKEEVEKVKGE